MWRPRDGKLGEFMGNAAEAKKIHERLGGKVRVSQTLFGGQPMTVVYVIEHQDMTAFAKFSDKMSADTEWQKFWTSAMASPSADFLQSSLLQEIDGL
ncbi:MAG: hypothetical protein ABJD24_05860 [Acidimicrobiales bacterium]